MISSITSLIRHLLSKTNYVDLGIDFLRNFSTYHRIQLSEDLRKSLEFVKSFLTDYNIESKMLFVGPSKIENSFGVFGWELDDVYAEIISPENIVIGSKEISELCSVVHSPSGEVSGEVVEFPKDPTKIKKVEGKIVIITENHRMIYYKALNAGAIGAIFARRMKDGFAIPYFGLFMRELLTDGGGIPAISISWHHAQQILKWIKQDVRVEVYMRINSRHKKNEKVPVLVATLGDGSPNIMAFAHSCHPKPGAHDNGSGVTALALSTLYMNVLYGSRSIKGSFTAIFAPEYSGSLAYILENSDNIKTMGVINLDMVGSTNLSNPISLSRGWLKNKSYVEPAFYASLKMLENIDGSTVKSYGVSLKDYSSGSDHDIFNYYGVPSFHVFHGIDQYYHSSHDTLENVNIKLVRDVAIAVVASNIISKNSNLREFLTRAYYDGVAFETIKRGVDALYALFDVFGRDNTKFKAYEECFPIVDVESEFPLIRYPMTLTSVLRHYGLETYEKLIRRFEPRMLSNMLFFIPGHIRSGIEYKDVVKLSRIELGVSENDVKTFIEILRL